MLIKEVTPMSEKYPESEWYIENGVRYRKTSINLKDTTIKKKTVKPTEKKDEETKNA